MALHPLAPRRLTVSASGGPRDEVGIAGHVERPAAVATHPVSHRLPARPVPIEGAVLALVNAIVFAGTWEHPFDASKTADAPFTREDGTKIQAPTMTKEDVLATAAIPNGRLVILPFAGKDLEMVILLPNAIDGLPAIEAAMTGEQLNAWIAGAQGGGEPTEFTLPKFKLDLSISLGEVLPALGVGQPAQAVDPRGGRRAVVRRPGRRRRPLRPDVAAAVVSVTAVPSSVISRQLPLRFRSPPCTSE